MESSVTKGSDLVKQLLSFVRGGQISFRQVELSGVVREIIGLVRQTFPKDMSVMFSGGDQPVEVMGDQTQLHQVLLNLFVNARDAMEGRGRIDVEITHQVVESGASDDLLPEGDYVMVSVSDTGPGVSPAVIGRIFEPFFTTKESGTGTGIGLSTCRTIVRAHGGSLYVENRPGRGATFRMLLPVVGRAGPVATAIPEAALGSGQLILVVDNEVSILGAIEETLSVHGYRVLTAANSEDALKLYRRYGDDLAAVVAESNLGENPGRSVLDVLADLNPNLPIIDLGGASGEGTPVGLPLRRRLRKPFTPGELLAAVDAVLDVA